MEQLNGYSRQELIGKHVSVLYPKDMVRMGVPAEDLAAAATSGRFEQEGWRLRRDGTQYRVRVVIHAMSDDQGRPAGYLMSSRDLTAQGFKDSALWNSEERFRLLVEGVQDYAIFMLDEKGRVMTWNIGAERIKGYRASEIIGKHFSTFYLPEAVQKGWPDQELKIARERGRLEDEGWRVRKDGSKFWASVIITPMKDPDGAVTGYSKVTRDLTERKRSEQMALQRAAQLRALAIEISKVEQRERRRLAQILHDHIQQLLVAAKIKLHAIHRTIEAEETLRDVVGLEDLLSEIIEASRSLSVDLSPPIIKEAGLARSLRWLADRVAQTHHLEVEVDAREAEDPVSENIRYLLFDAARELLLNVTKHSGTQKAKVSMDRTGLGFVSLKVEDRGAGMTGSPEAQRGFGLMTLRERAEALGGVLRIKSGPGEGMAVTLSIPDVELMTEPAGPVPDAMLQTAAATSLSQVGPGGRPIRVLVVDDHYIVRQGLVGLLKDTPLMSVVGEASNGEEAVEKALELKPDVVIMDVNMPIMNGIEATRRIKKELDERVAVIGLSIYTEAQIANSMREAGASSYLAKNAPPEDLVQAIRSCRTRLES